MLEWDILNYLKKWRTNLRATICHAAKIHNILRTCFNVINKKCIYPSGETKKKASFTGYLLYRETTSVTPEITKKIFLLIDSI